MNHATQSPRGELSVPGGRIPRALLADPEVQPGPKVLYAMIWALQTSGEDEITQDLLAELLGRTSRTIYSWTVELERSGWIRIIQAGAMQANRYALEQVAA